MVKVIAWNSVLYGLLTLLCLSILFPFLYLIVVSVTNETNMADWDRASLSLSAYSVIFSSGSLMVQSFLVSVLRTTVGVLLNMTFSVLLAYSLSKRGMPGRKGMMIFIFITMVFSGGLIPSYIVVTSLGMYNTFWAMIVPGLISAYNVILLRNFFMELPDSVEESAKMDGASEYRILWRIVLPLSTPVLATVSLFYAVGHWNEWFSVLLYINDNQLWPLQVYVRNLVVASTNVDAMLNLGDQSLLSVSPEAIKMAALMVATVPILMVYPFLQRFFVQGIMLGAVKE